jgi:phage gpG-like protein
MIRGELVGDKAVIRSLKEQQLRVVSGVERVVTRLVMKLLRRVKLKLSDDVLHVRSGRLRRSINAQFTGKGAKVQGEVGTNLPYGRVHEFGLTVTVEEHMRLVKKAFGRSLRTPVQSVVHAHEVRYPERSFLRSALREMQPEIRSELDEFKLSLRK